MQIRKTFLFNTKRDSEILDWLDQQDNASEAVREALRFAIGQQRQTITLEDIYNELQELKRRGIVLAHDDENDNYREPPDIAANLDKLGL